MMGREGALKKLRVLPLLLGLSAWLPVNAMAQQVEYYHLDAIGSVRAVTNASGAIIVRHDYEPYGREWNPPVSNDTRRFTGKERDAESGWDYSGARYYSALVARFMSVDPVYTWSENVADPERWNRYAYVRNNPLKYNDPSGKVLELVGNRKGEALDLIRELAGSGSVALYTREDSGRTYVEYSGAKLEAASQMGVLVADLINHPKTVQLSVGHKNAFVLESKYERATLFYFGGAATIGSEESKNGVTQVYLSMDAGAIATRAFSTPLMIGRSSDRNPLRFDNATVLAHELGHAYANLNGKPIFGSTTTFVESLFWENTWRTISGSPNKRVIH